MRYFFCRLIPPRPTFQEDMTDAERSLMLQHGAYWTGLAERGTAIVFGPVADPTGGYGVGIVEIDDGADVRDVEAHDPAMKSGLGFRYEMQPMPRAVLRK